MRALLPRGRSGLRGTHVAPQHRFETLGNRGASHAGQNSNVCWTVSSPLRSGDRCSSALLQFSACHGPVFCYPYPSPRFSTNALLGGGVPARPQIFVHPSERQGLELERRRRRQDRRRRIRYRPLSPYDPDGGRPKQHPQQNQTATSPVQDQGTYDSLI